MNMKEAIAQSSVLTVSHANTDTCGRSGDSDQLVGSKRAGEASVCSSKHSYLASVDKESNVERHLQYAAPPLQ